ncbi:hypothetical protein RIF23_07860 [Lipingzhangella sp. LS1_29]|uniref:Uncharacterized protein n=1 Tax=Lipingzhangella rawalii TaxID=2055835 RepID=A0ABU2H4H5_9ACTN|nr:hypothetical protein [Lipingzhangella rawalii]MDS1270207.1 hypothetical protein [Lipingzhangella rawalii]
MFSAIAMSKDDDPVEQERFLGYAHTSIIIGVLLGIPVMLLLFAGFDG